MRKFVTVLMAMILSLSAIAAERTEIKGKILLHDTETVPGDFVVVYAQSFGAGTMSDENGEFSLKVPAGSGKETTIEISRIGYTMVQQKVVLNGSIVDLGEIVLEQQTLMLMAAYVTDDGKTPEEAILSKLWANCKQNRKKTLNYRAEVDYNIATHELPVVAEALPSLAVGAVKVYASHEGYGPLIRYCLKNDDFSVHASMCRQVKNGNTSDFSKKLISSNRKLPDDVKRNVLDIFQFMDFYDIMYGTTNAWGEKFAKKHKFHLTGTYEYGDKLVDVLSHTDRHKRATTVIHIVEDDWMIMKLQVITKEGEVLRCEARNIGNGVYMPISLVLKPSATVIRAKDIPEMIFRIQDDKNIKPKTKEKMIKVLEENQGHDFNPYVSLSGNVRYRIL